MPKLKTILQSKLLIILVIIWCLVNLFVVRHQSKYKENTTTISGTVLDYNFNGNLLKLTVKAQEKIKANYYLKNEEEKEQLEKTLGYNSTVVLKGTLSKPLENDIPNVFSYQKYLEHHQIYYVFNVSSLSIKPSSNILYQIKNWCYKRITNIKDSEYLKAFILGDNTDIANDLFRTNGVSHLFAISGMHLSLLVLILSKISFFKKNWPIILFLWFYAFLVGFTPSILRSVLFFTLKILIKKNISNLKLLIIVMEIMLLKNPFYIYDIGFIYSFLISFGLLTYQFVKTTKFQNLLKISIFIFFLSLPITAINFYKINFLTIILNIILIPLVSSIIYPLALLTFIFPIFNNVFNGFIILLIFINKLGEMFKFGILVIPKVTIFIWLIYYYLFFQAFYLRRCLYFFALLFLLFLIHIYPYFTTDLNISYLSVGQGDCTLLVSPKLKDVILIDTGGTFQLKKELWAESKTKNYQVDNITTYLNSLGINHIDTLILTHGDYDHAGNASELLSKFSVKKVIFNNDSYNDLEKSLINQLEKQNIPYINQITSLNFGNYQLNFLVTDLSDNENDNSNVIYFKYQQYQFLFMGDASKNREMAILNKYNLKNIDFLKVGHHGSDTSSGKDFISKIKPKYSIISVGLNNRYNHPKESVLNILANSKIYRTDQDGSIIIKFHNHNYQIFTKNDYT